MQNIPWLIKIIIKLFIQLSNLLHSNKGLSESIGLNQGPIPSLEYQLVILQSHIGSITHFVFHNSLKI